MLHGAAEWLGLDDVRRGLTGFRPAPSAVGKSHQQHFVLNAGERCLWYGALGQVVSRQVRDKTVDLLLGQPADLAGTGLCSVGEDLDSAGTFRTYPFQ